MCRIPKPWFVCPSGQQEGFFTTAAIDNIDKNFSSVTSLNSFQGTTISVFQHAGRDAPLQSYPFQLNLNDGLPDSYTEIKPTSECRPEPPVTLDYNSKIDSSRTEVENFASRWIDKIAEEDSLVGDEPMSF